MGICKLENPIAREKEIQGPYQGRAVVPDLLVTRIGRAGLAGVDTVPALRIIRIEMRR